MSLHPTEGARFKLERRAVTADGARYAGEIYTPDACYRFALELGGEAPVVTAEGPADEAAPAELVAQLTMIAKLTARSALAQTPPAWPHRVLRWRGPGRGS